MCSSIQLSSFNPSHLLPTIIPNTSTTPPLSLFLHFTSSFLQLRSSHAQRMGEEEVVKVESSFQGESLPVPEPEPAGEASKDAAEEKSIETLPPSEEKPEECKALAIAEKDPHSGSINRDEVLAKVETEKRLSLIKAWEESEKSKAENKAHKKLSEIGAWENCKKASVEAELKQIEEKLEKEKAEYVEKMRNKIALIHKSAVEKKAIVEAKKAEAQLQAEETAAKYRATGTAPKKLLGLF